MFVCKPYYPDTTNIVWGGGGETWPRRALEDSKSAFDIKKEKKQRRVRETEVSRDGRICGGGERKKRVNSRTALPFLSVSKQLIIEGQRGRERLVPAWRYRIHLYSSAGRRQAGRRADTQARSRRTHAVP